MPSSMTLVLFCCISLFATIQCDINYALHRRKVEENILNSIFVESYDPRIRPSGVSAEDRNQVNVTVDVLNVYKMDEKQGIVGININLDLNWIDDRLRYSKVDESSTYVTLNGEEDSIWTPPIYFNEIQQNRDNLVGNKHETRIYYNGMVHHSLRRSLEIPCSTGNKNFPFDVQQCILEIQGYLSEMNSHIDLSWSAEEETISTEDIFVMVSLFSLKECNLEKISGSVEKLELTLYLERNVQSFVITAFIPCAMCVIICYSIFWIEIKHFIIRIFIGIATLFSLMNLVSDINSTHDVGVDALSVYTGGCMTFVFAGFMETMLVYLVNRKNESEINSKISDGYCEVGQKEKASKIDQVKLWFKESSCDTISKVLYPVAFSVFQVLYWAICLSL